jgi:hypothetical protein
MCEKIVIHGMCWSHNIWIMYYYYLWITLDIETCQPLIHVFWRNLPTLVMFKHAQQLSIKKLLSVSKNMWQITIRALWLKSGKKCRLGVKFWYVTLFVVCPKNDDTQRSKWHLMNQCLYFAFRTIVLFKVLLPKKHVFIKRNFQMKYFEIFYLLYL